MEVALDEILENSGNQGDWHKEEMKEWIKNGNKDREAKEWSFKNPLIYLILRNIRMLGFSLTNLGFWFNWLNIVTDVGATLVPHHMLPFHEPD